MIAQRDLPIYRTVAETGNYNFPQNVVTYIRRGDLVSVDSQETKRGFVPCYVFNKSGFVQLNMLSEYSPLINGEYGAVLEDREIRVAAVAGRASQFISLRGVYPAAPAISYNLCGEFACAQVCGVSVSSLVGGWVNGNANAAKIIKGDLGTGDSSIAQMLKLFGKNSEVLLFGSASNPPALFSEIKARLPGIVGCGIDAMGRVYDKRIISGSMITTSVRHWVVGYALEQFGQFEVLKIYNPYWNRFEEVLLSDVIYNGAYLKMIRILQ